MHAEGATLLHDGHHKMSSSIKVHQNTQNSATHEVMWKRQTTLSNMKYSLNNTCLHLFLDKSGIPVLPPCAVKAVGQNFTWSVYQLLTLSPQYVLVTCLTHVAFEGREGGWEVRCKEWGEHWLGKMPRKGEGPRTLSLQYVMVTREGRVGSCTQGVVVGEAKHLGEGRVWQFVFTSWLIGDLITEGSYQKKTLIWSRVGSFGINSIVQLLCD